MRNGLRMFGAAALSLAAPHLILAQSPALIPPPPGTPVAPLDVPAYVLPQAAPRTLSLPLAVSDKPAGRKIINTTMAQVDYRIDTVGPSGVGRVDIYVTADQGATWIKVGEDDDKQSPANVNLPGEGLYGIRLAIMNGNGFGGRAPRAGDRPQLYVEVDAASPTVALLPHEMVPNLGAIDIRWTASDPNLAPEPVSIFVRSRPDATWQAIAKNIKNDGSYRWSLPRDIPGQIFLKLEAVDLAGNVTKIETPTPIALDQTEPEATIVDAAASHLSSTTPTPPILPPVNLPVRQ